MKVHEVVLTLSIDDVKMLRYLAIEGYPLEVCGAIYPHGVVQYRNVHCEPDQNYDAEIDLEDVKAIWHSHPDGPDAPSEQDIVFMNHCAAHGLHIHHIIVTPKSVHEYEVVSDSSTSAA